MRLLSIWKKWIRQFTLGLYALVLLIVLIVMIVELADNDAPPHVVGFFVGGLFVLFSLPISLFGILQHLIHYSNPTLQRHIIRILWMVPVYALNSWLALRFPNATIYLDTLRECYEAYVIYNFMTYLLSYLHSRQYGHPSSPDDFFQHMAKMPKVRLLFPLCNFRPWKNGELFINRCKHGVLQYTVIRPITTIIALICELTHTYGEGEFTFTSAWSYLVIINNISQGWAMYCLLLFYMATKEELAPIKPVTKLLCVKAVVFFSFWQSTIISILVASGAIQEDPTWVTYTPDKVGAGLQDFCICVEMFFAAIAHYFSFSHKPYVTSATADLSSLWLSFKSMWDLEDVRQDVFDHVRTVGMGIGTVVIRQPPSSASEQMPLLTLDRSNSVTYHDNPTLSTDFQDSSEDEKESILFSSNAIPHKLLDTKDHVPSSRF